MEAIDHRFGHRLHTIPVGKIGKLHGFDAVRLDQIVLDGEALRQAHGPRAMRSRGCDEHLQMDGLGEFGQFPAGLGAESGIGPRDAYDGVEQA